MTGAHRVVVDRDLPMVTRDGVTLRADVHRPDAPGTFPVLLQRTPYGKSAELPGVDVRERDTFPPHGYVVVVQDTRGRHASDGEFTPFVHEAADGHDAVEWAATLPWSDGNVGMVGQSYGATAQYLTAPLRPAHLRAAAPVSGPVSFLRDCLYRDGVLELAWVLTYVPFLARPDRPLVPPSREALEHLPVRDWADRLAADAPYLADILDHRTDDAYWHALDSRRRCQDVDVPMLHVSSWYDAFQADTLAMFTGLRERARTARAREGQHLLMGPWAHRMSFATPTSQGTGEIDFGHEALIDLHDIERRWFDRYLKGRPDQLPRVRLFVIGDDRWRDEDEWPLARTRYTDLFLHSGGSADRLRGDGTLTLDPPGDEPVDRFVHDPADPVPTRGGAVVGLPAGVYDQREIEERPDVLVYTGAPLDRDLEITGPVRLRLFASSSSRDTDFVGRLVDVHPGGYAANVVEGVVRSRFRSSLAHPSLIEPGRAYEYDIDLWATSYVFKAGHRLRLEVCSSSFPRWVRSPGTGEDPVDAVRLAPAQQTVLHDARHPSRLVLPVIPR